jgi:diketogulonate reductase-like aldo/keto reductase
MQFRRFGPLSREVAVIGQGTWNIERDKAGAVAALRRGLELGMTHIDTAEMYGSGAAEEIVGEAIRGRRHEIFLVSKVLPQNATRLGTRQACERSLARLGTDRLDCYLLHWRGSHPLEGTLAAFEELRRTGKILSWGVSNFDESDLAEAWRIAGDQLACNQVLYHVRQRAIEHAVLPWCEGHEVALVGYSPFGQGDFPSPRSAGGLVLAEIGREHGASARQVVLAYLTRRPSVWVIPKASGIAHVEENARAGDLNLSADDIARIDRAFPLGAPPRSLPML